MSDDRNKPATVAKPAFSSVTSTIGDNGVADRPSPFSIDVAATVGEFVVVAHAMWQ
jgi:hypothetical protein